MIPYSCKQFNWLAYQVNNTSFARVAPSIAGEVLDLGCGEKPFKKEIQSVADTYVGVDWPATLHAKSEIDVYADISKDLPIKNESFDTVVSFQVMEHLPEPAIFLREACRVLRPGGKIILTTPFMWGVHEAPHDYYRYTPFGLKHLLTRAGFMKINVTPNTGFWIMAGLRFNYHLYRFNNPLLKLFFIVLFWLIQTAARLLDRVDFNPDDAASYTATAEKQIVS